MNKNSYILYAEKSNLSGIYTISSSFIDSVSLQRHLEPISLLNVGQPAPPTFRNKGRIHEKIYLSISLFFDNSFESKTRQPDSRVIKRGYMLFPSRRPMPIYPCHSLRPATFIIFSMYSKLRKI